VTTPPAPRPSGRSPILIGRVVEFDEGRGIGLVASPPRAPRPTPPSRGPDSGSHADSDSDSDSDSEYPFHCTALTDGTRTIAVGTAVVFILVPGHLGRMEATAISPLPKGGD